MLVGLLPGLMVTMSEPAQAVAAFSAVVSQERVETPRQMAGTTTGALPPLTPTTAVWQPQSRSADKQPPKGALPLERGRDEAPVRPKKRDLPSGVARAEQLDAGCCSPFIEDRFPLHGALVGTLTPTMTAYVAGSDGIDYTFNVCDSWLMEDGFCVSSGVLSDVHTWRVPAGKLEWGKEYYWQVIAKNRLTTAITTSDTYTFTTGVRQPVMGSQLSARGVNGQEFNQLSGNYTTAFTDAQVTAAGPPLSVVRSYNTLDVRVDGMFGAGWSTHWDMKIVREPKSLLVTQADGRVSRFAPKGDGTFQPPPGMHATLAEQQGGGWRLMDKSSTSYLFDAAGRLVKIRDGRGRSQDLVYGSNGRLESASVAGRTLRFGWTGAHVTSVSTDAVDGKALTWTYEYDGDRLTASCSPTATPNCTRYGYGSGSAYRSTILDSDPYGYWRFNETTGTDTANLGWGAGPATYTNPSLAQQGALAGTGDTAVHFDAGELYDGEVRLRDNVIARLAGQLSVETWLKTTKPGVVFSSGGSGSSDGAIYIGTDGKLRGQFRSLEENDDDVWYTPITSAGTVTDGRWHHVVLTADEGSDRLYLDGKPVGTLQTPRDIYSWSSEARFAGGQLGWRWPAESSSFQGELDEAAVYDRPLTQAEVEVHYAARLEAPNKLTKITLPSGRVWASNIYDAATDRIKTHTDQHGGTWQIAAPVIDYNVGTSTVTVTDPNNKTIKTVHDGWRDNRIVFVTDQLGYETAYDYDTGGFRAQVIDANYNQFTWANDERGNPISSTSCRGSNDCQTAYATYYLKADDEFDPRNDRQLTSRDARSSSQTDNTYATTYEYNSYGEQTKQTTPATADFPNGRSVTIAYTDGTEPAINGGTTPAGLVAKKTDARGNAWTYRYTAAGDLAEQTNPAGLVTKLEYDAIGRLSASTQVSQAHPGGVKTTFTYDGLGRLVTQTEPGVKNEVSQVTHTKQTTFGYDPDGNKLSEKVADLTGGDAERTTVYTYDGQGRLETTTDPEGGVVRQAWNTVGLVVRVTDARGTVIENGYTNRGQLATRTVKGWTGSPVNPQPAKDVLLESYSYDAAGRLVAQSDAMGRKTSFEYYNDNLLYKKIADDVKLNDPTASPRDVVLEKHAYDAAGNRTSLVTPNGMTSVETVATQYVYDAASRLASQTLSPGGLNRKTAFVYDANGNVLRKTLTGSGTSRSEVTEYVYDKMNLATKTTVENGADDLVSTSDYDDRSLVVATTDPRGNATGADKAAFTSTLRYDALGRLVEATGPQVKVDKAGSSSDARPSARYGYDAFGGTTHERDAEGRTITSVFDKAGRLASKSAPPYTPPGGTAITPTTSHGYDKAGQLIRTTDPRGYTSTFEYDQLGRQVRVTDPAPEGETPGRWVAEYDMAGEQLAAVDPTGARSQATYDDLGRKITETQVERKPSAAAYITKLEYDDAGRLVKSVAPGNRTTTFKVNAAGEVTEQTDPAANTTTMDYDPAGRPTKTTNVALTTATLAEYDLAGRKTAFKDLKGATVLRTMSTGYDPAGNPITLTSGEGHVTKQTFDALNRLTSLIEPVKDGETITTSFGYDATGARTRLTDGRGNATWTTYNTLGLVETMTEPSTTAHPDAADRTWTAVYDQAGNPTALIQPGGVRIDRTFDHLGRLTKETGGGGGSASAERSFGYDLAGRQTTIGDLTIDYNDRALPLSIKRGTAQQTGYSYDELGNPTQRVDAAGTATFTWDNAGRLWTATDPVTTRKITYDYDQANRVKTMTAKVGTTSADTQAFTYDDMDRPKTHTLKSSTGSQLAQITYGWDKDDNLTTKTTAGLAGAGTNTYGYDHAGRLTSWTVPGGAQTLYEWDAAGNRTKAGDKTYTYDERNRLTSGDGSTYTYTPRGTMATETKNGATTQLTFDAFDRLIGDGDSLYSYDSLDRVTTRTRGTTKQTFAYTGLTNDLAAISDTSGAVQAKYGRDAFGGLLGQKEGTNPAVSTMNDLHNDLVATYTSTALATSTAYDPFGSVTAETGAKNLLGYQGAYTDPDTGKVNMHARWYQPGTGSFTSRDTATLTPNPSVQVNRYTYANASPLTGIDPTGHESIVVSGDAVGGTWKSPYSPGGYQTAADYYPQVGGAGTPYGPVRDDYQIGDCLACVSADQVVWGAVTVMTKEEMKRQGVLPNGWITPKGFWDLDKKAREEIIQMAYAGVSTERLDALWRKMKMASSASGASRNVSRAEVERALVQNEKLEFDLQKCHSHLDDKGCRKLIEDEWESWRRLFCGNSRFTPSCTATPAAKAVAKISGIPVKLFEFLGTQVTFISNAEFNKRLVRWARDQGGKCSNKGPGTLYVCTGLKSGVHFGRAATTLGNVVLTGNAPSPSLLKHEAEHARQWNWYYSRTNYWPTYLVYYLDQDKLNPCNNKYEQQADAVSATYKC
ncbi:LamG-like jellyroll fold domain-containing protein [Nonomuraea sp. NPDC050691]|uniref:LamG-like jellyroll fold domain-containing protein n=1 Tax=Nonomuraea sp. NPDC050691 TaxID=3155661 RepID=UPI0033E241A4